MSAERLREAATLLRERATAATPGAWEAIDESNQFFPVGGQGGIGVYAKCADQQPGKSKEAIVTDFCDWEWKAGDASADASFIATMSPPVALALADWLTALANQVAVRPRDKHITNAALRVADTVLGTPA